MRIINIIGLSVFLELYKKYNSILGLCIFCNGILFHSNYRNIYLKLYDILFNFIAILMMVFRYFQLLKYHFLLSIGIFFINYYCFDVLQLYHRDISDLIHIFGVQYILSLGLLKIIKKNNFINKWEYY